MIGVKSEELAAAMGGGLKTGRTTEREARRRAALVQRLQEEDMEGCTFTPKITPYAPRVVAVTPPRVVAVVPTPPSPTASPVTPSHSPSQSLLTTLARNDEAEMVGYGWQLMQAQLLQMNKKKLLSKLMK